MSVRTTSVHQDLSIVAGFIFQTVNGAYISGPLTSITAVRHNNGDEPA